MKKILKWLAYIAATLIVIVTVVAGITQTQFFRNELRSYALEQLDSLLDAEVHLGEIQGNLIAGFSIDSVAFQVRGETFVSARRLDIHYDLFQIPSKRISVNRLILVEPHIALICGRDSIWNFHRMVRPTPDDTTSKPFDWPVAVGRLEIRNGSFRLIDSAALREPDHVLSDPRFVEYHDVTAESLNLVMTSALIAPTDKRVTINSLTFFSRTPDIRMREFSGEFRVTEKFAEVKKLHVRTSATDLRLTAKMENVDLLDGIDLPALRTKPVELSLRATNLDLDELSRFIEPLDFLEGRVNTEIVAAGQFGQLHLQQLNVKMRNSQLYFAGTVSNLHHPERLRLQVKCRETTIDYADVLALMPSFGLPDYTSLGMAHVSFDFDGEPLAFMTNLDVRTDAGTVSTRGASLAIGGPETLQYKGEFLVHRLQPGVLLRDNAVAGEFNGVVAIEGRGTSLDDVTGTLYAQVDSSSFAGVALGPSYVSFTAANKTFTGSAGISVGGMRSEVRGELSRVDMGRPTFKIEGRIASLNLADILHAAEHNSDITMDLKAEGTGLAWEKLNAVATLDLSSSRYREYHIDSSRVHVVIDQRDPLNSSIVVESGVADFSIRGQFDLDYMVSLIRYEVDNLSLAVGQRFKSLDSTLATSLDENELAGFGARLAATKKTLNAEYQLALKDLEPLSILAADRTFDAVGTVRGSLKGNYERLEGRADVQLQEFFYGNADSGVHVQDGVASLAFNDLKPVNPLAELTLRIRADAGKMHLNRTKLDTMKLGIFYDKEYAGFVVQADYDRDVHLKTNGQVGVTDDGVQFTLSRFSAAYRDFAWTADDGAVIAVNSNGMRIQHVTLRRDSQVVSIQGSVLQGGALDAVLACRNLNLASIAYLLPQDEHQAGRRAFEGVAVLDASARGSLESPVYRATLRARNVFYRGFPFGEIGGMFDYEREALGVKILIDNRADRTAGSPDLSITGVLPVNLALQGGGEGVSDRPMDFTVHSDGLQMSLLDPLVPTFNEMTGILKANVKVGGSPKKPNFTGTMSIEGCSFLFVPNNMYYKLDGTFRPEGERIKVLTTTIRNVDSDNRPGRTGVIDVTGDLALRELVPSDFNFTINGRLLVVNRNTRTSSLAVYGELPVEIAGGGLHFSGDVRNTLLRGQVLVRNSTLAFPPTSSTAKEDTFFIPFRIIDDTTKVVETPGNGNRSKYFTSAMRERLDGYAQNEERPRSFIDGLRYDLSVEFAGSNNEIRMIFNPSTNEELVANITGHAAITDDGKTWNGTMDVTRASYNFYGKRFDAEGRIIYTGDLLNPELDIVATYKGSRKYDEVSTEENVVVTYKITGTRFAPRPDISMTIDGVDYYAYKTTPTSNDVQSDALTFIITNNFPLTRGERNNIAEQVGPTVGAGLVGSATSLLTSTLAEFLRNRTGFINSFEFRYDQSGTFGQSADVRLGGTAFKGYWRYGGKILEDPFSNANFSILYSFGDIFDRPALRNFMVELERKVDTLTLFGSVEARKEITSARFFYRISF